MPPVPHSTPRCLANISAYRASERTSISRVIFNIGGELTVASSFARWGVVAVCLDARASIPAPRIASTNSRVANCAGPRCLSAEPWL